MKADMENATERVQQNVRNLPITSMALAGLFGAGAVALAAAMKPKRKP